MDVLKSAIDEIKIIKDPRITLEVNLYEELTEDMGGPRILGGLSFGNASGKRKVS